MAYDPNGARRNPRDRFRSHDPMNDNGDEGFFFVSRYARDLPPYLLRSGSAR